MKDPNIIIYIDHEQYEWTPLEDITAFEFAKFYQLLAVLQVSQYPEKDEYIKKYNLIRHFTKNDN